MKTSRQVERALIDFLYWGCRVAALPLLVFYFLYRCVRDRRYLRRFTERFGGLPAPFQATPSGAIWLHAVSVGEVISVVGLLRELRARCPAIPIYISVGTVAGRGIAQDKLIDIVNGIFYAPVDYTFAVRRAFRRIRPAVLVVLETEIWPVLYREAKHFGAALLILNGRISQRAFPRYRQFRFFFRHVLNLPDAIYVQSDRDRAHYFELGAPEERLRTIGNLKYDSAPVTGTPPQLVNHLLEALKPQTVWIAASTMPPLGPGDIDEDDSVIAAFQELAPRHPALLLILVPRRPERFSTTEHKLHELGIPYVLRSRNKLDANIQLPCVLLLDTIGELASIFPLGNVVFMGGSLVHRGGHNILEPAGCGRAVIVGPHMENFAAIAAEFRENHAVLEIQGPGELAAAVEKLILDSQLREDLGTGAAALTAKHRGATAKAADVILRLQDTGIPCIHPPLPLKAVLAPISWAWATAGSWNFRRSTAAVKRLNTPVISVGGISMGGAGKTPMAAYLADRLREAKRTPAILTRGYRRKSIAKSILIEAGTSASVDLTGDEAQIFVRAGRAHVGVGSDRWHTGSLLEEKYRPGVFLLDDGFQHYRLARNLDLVLIDALNPFAGGSVFPLGDLREPLTALARASAFVIVRTVPGRAYAGIERVLRQHNPQAPIFRAKVLPLFWINERTRQPGHPPEGGAGAFCGLANPATFWDTLRSLGVTPLFQWTFDDHHKYQWQELQRLAGQARLRGSNVLLTTEKDAMNLPERAAEVLNEASVDLYWLKIGIQLDDESRFLELIESVC